MLQCDPGLPRPEYRLRPVWRADRARVPTDAYPTWGAALRAALRWRAAGVPVLVASGGDVWRAE